MNRFHGQTYLYPTPNHGVREIGVTTGLGTLWGVWFYDDDGTPRRVNSPHLKSPNDPADLQRRLDQFAKERGLLENVQVRQSPRERLEMALQVLSDPILRLKVRRIWETEMEGCSVFWDAAERQIELIGNTHEIIIREASDQRHLPAKEGV